MIYHGYEMGAGVTQKNGVPVCRNSSFGKQHCFRKGKEQPMVLFIIVIAGETLVHTQTQIQHQYWIIFESYMCRSLKIFAGT